MTGGRPPPASAIAALHQYFFNRPSSFFNIDAVSLLVASDDAAVGRRLVERLVAAGMPAWLETEPGALANACRRAPPHASVLRWHTGNLSAILIGRLRTWWPMPVVALTNGDLPAAIRALRAGAYNVMAETDFDVAHAREALADGERIAAAGYERLGPYEIYELVGTGGMGTVHRAKDLRDGREVALKILRPEQAAYPDFHLRFHREVDEAKALNHPALTAVYEGGVARGRYYIAMQFVRGRTLDRVLLDSGRLPVRRALMIARRIAEGLGSAHALGRVHRDVKPDNIVIGPDDAVHLMDFGLLRRTEDSAIITAKGEFVGTVRYASPEHMRGEKVDARGDLYSLGVLIYEMVAGARPHDGRDTMRLARDVAYGAMPRPLHETAPDVPQEVSALVQQLLAHRAEDRPASAKEVVEAIDRIVH
jgi:hypothetical protein